MDRQAYLNHLVALASELQAKPEDGARRRQAYVARLVELGRDLLATRAPSSTDAATFELFERVIMSSPREILWRVAGATLERRKALSPSHRAMLGVLEMRPDLLGPLGLARDEGVHSALVAHFLNRRESADVGAACLARFVDLLLHPSHEDEQAGLPDELDLTEADVRLERNLGQYGRVDISLESPYAVVLVETKIDAAERERQLPDYAAALGDLCARGNRQGVLVFLTCDPEQTPSVRQAVRHVTFRELLRSWLPIAIAGRNPEHLYLSMYLKTIAAHLYGLAEPDAFDDWTLRTQRSALRFLEAEVEVE